MHLHLPQTVCITNSKSSTLTLMDSALSLGHTAHWLRTDQTGAIMICLSIEVSYNSLFAWCLINGLSLKTSLKLHSAKKQKTMCTSRVASDICTVLDSIHDQAIKQENVFKMYVDSGFAWCRHVYIFCRKVDWKLCMMVVNPIWV